MCKDKMVDYDSHMNILDFLIYLEDRGLMNKSQRVYYSMYIPNYLNEKEENIKLMEDLLESIK